MNDQSSPSHPLKAIARKFEVRESRQLPQDQPTTEILPGGNWPSLSPRPIQSPAVLIDNALRVIWQNEAAWIHLWRQPETIEAESAIHLFDLLLNSQFRNSVTNWRDWATFFIQQARPLASPQEMQLVLEQRDEAEREILIPLLNNIETTCGAGFQTNCLQMMLADASSKIIFSVVGTTFDKGRLLVFEAMIDSGAQTTTSMDLRQRFAMIRSQPTPVQKLFYAMSVRLNHANALKSEMLDEDYSRLLHRLWGQIFETMEQSSGIVTQFTSDGLIGFFLPPEESEPNPLFVIQCALALKTRMGELGREWKIRRGWLHDIQLNIGIEAGSEYMMMLPTIFGENLIPSGNTVQVAACLSQMADDGQIWATKSLIKQVPSNDLKSIRFGIFRKENNRRIFIAKSFLRMRELPLSNRVLTDIPEDFAIRPVTQIFDRTLQE